ncbi:MAG TPA: nuclear transport factor 2 family protein [Solirubrobacterales bacterium]
MPATTETETRTDEDAILATLRRFSRAFDSFDTEQFMSTWDEEAEIVYQPEELLHPIFDRDELRAYFDHLPEVIRRFNDNRVIDFKLHRHGELATVYVRFWSRISFAKVPQTADGQIRQTFVLRRREGSWLLVHYHESRQASGMEEAVGNW